MLELSDEHGGHTVNRCAVMRFYCLQRCFRIECFRRDHDRGAVSHRRQIGHDTAEAMVKRHLGADAIRFGVVQDFTDEETVVQDVVMRERRTFRRAGCA
jgi:hypothetical protein